MASTMMFSQTGLIRFSTLESIPPAEVLENLDSMDKSGEFDFNYLISAADQLLEIDSEGETSNLLSQTKEEYPSPLWDVKCTIKAVPRSCTDKEVSIQRQGDMKFRVTIERKFDEVTTSTMK